MLNALERYRHKVHSSKAAFGRALGYTKANPSRFFERIETGEVPADADIVERIAVVTEGAVTAADMHTIRLAWLRKNRPERFHDTTLPAGPETVTGIGEQSFPSRRGTRHD